MSEENCYLYNQCNHKDCGADFCIRKFRTDELYNRALLSNKQKERITLRVDPDNTDLEAFTKLSNYSKNIEQFVNEGHNLFIYSNGCGNGKTSWAIRFIQEYINKIWYKSDSVCRALFIDMPKFITAMKDKIDMGSNYFEYIINNVEKANLVVWDDIATKIATQYEIERILPLINNRLNSGKANIYTSNLNCQDMYMALDKRLASRVCNSAEVVEFKGLDKRFMLKESK